MAKRIVYHGTLSDEPPHVHGEPFHAGTLNAAYDRLEDETGHGSNESSTMKVHGYEISDNVPTSRRTWQDPMFAEDTSQAVPEHKQNRVYPYKNEREDRGSTSFVIPSSFVGNHVKHLGIQFQHFTNPYDDRHEKAVEVMSTMVGGRKK